MTRKLSVCCRSDIAMVRQNRYLILVVAALLAGVYWLENRKTPVQEVVKVIYKGDNPKLDRNPKTFTSAYPRWISNHIPANMTDFRNADTESLYNIYFSFTDAVEVICEKKVRLGRLGDGGWDVCDDEGYQPRKPCLIYSFGIAGDWSFDDAAENIYGCEIHSFDPSIKVAKPQRSKLITFHEIGLDGKDGQHEKKNWTMKTLKSIKKELGHENKIIDVLKIDIESSEWKALPTSIADHSIQQVRQLNIELHIGRPKRQTIIHGIETLLNLYNAGFRKFFAHKNPLTKNSLHAYKGTLTACAEISYLNMAL